MKKRVSIFIGLVFVFGLSFGVFANPDTLTVVSDNSVMVYGPLTSYAPPEDAAWGSSKNAMATWEHSSWPWRGTAQTEGEDWISTSYYIGDSDDGGPIGPESWRWFTKSVFLCAGAYNIQGTITATSDNAEDVYVNGTFIGSDGEVSGSWNDDHEWSTIIDYPFTTDPLDTLKLDFIVRNYTGNNNPTENPTGLIFKAVVTFDCAIQINIDIKPGSYPNCFNINGHGVVPVAILGSTEFDVSQIDVSTIKFAGLDVRVKGNGNPQCSIEDASGLGGVPDGYDDLVCQFVDDVGAWSPDTGTATIIGQLLDGTPFEGSDEICLRPE